MKWHEKLLSLKKGWNGYTALPPTSIAVENARKFLQMMEKIGAKPTRIAPTAMGGVAITRKVGCKRILVEFYNDGKIYSMFSNGVLCRVKPLSEKTFESCIKRMLFLV